MNLGKKGSYYSNFYGGALVRSTDLAVVRDTLEAAKQEMHLFGEIKWTKVTANYLDKYSEMMRVFFGLIADDKVKVRIMFTQNANVAQGLDAYQRENEFYLLYYQFIKHGFGLRYSNSTGVPIGLRVYLDNLPDTSEKRARFKAYLAALNNSRTFMDAQLQIRSDQIAEVTSHDHVILQCLDVVLGAMYFRLNNLHKVKPKGKYRRAKRTIAKDRLYHIINGDIREIYPGFNVGVSTGVAGDYRNRWLHPYRHWLFIPDQYKVDASQFKPR